MLTLRLELWRTMCSLMDKWMPLRSIRMSSRDPSWMSPLVRSMLRAKTRVLLNNRERLKLANSRISQVISENRRNPASVMGSWVWWKNVDLVSQRRARTTCVNFDHASMDHLNNYFGRSVPWWQLSETYWCAYQGACGSSRDNTKAGLECSY